MKLADLYNCYHQNIPCYWYYKKPRKVLIDEIVEEFEGVKFDPPMVFFKVMYRGHKICIDDCEPKDLYLTEEECYEFRK